MFGTGVKTDGAEKISTEYLPKVKFEINSLNGVLNNLLLELKEEKSKNN